MRRLAVTCLALASAVVAHAGCIAPGGGCGAFDGQQNRLFERQSEMIVLCDNGGFVAALDTTMVEGRFQWVGGHVVATRGEDGQLAFELSNQQDGTNVAPQLGDGAWSEVYLDAVALDHSNKLCEDLPNRTWWTQL